jgi:hypothetical protein
LAAISDDSSRWLSRVQVLDGVAIATDGHRMHWKTTSLADGQYLPNGDAHLALAPEAAPFTLRASEMEQSLENTRVITLAADTWRTVHLRMGALPRGAWCAIQLRTGETQIYWQLSAVSKERRLKLYNFTGNAVWRDPPGKWGASVSAADTPQVQLSAEYLLDALNHVSQCDLITGLHGMDPVIFGDPDRGAIVMPVASVMPVRS